MIEEHEDENRSEGLLSKLTGPSKGKTKIKEGFKGFLSGLGMSLDPIGLLGEDIYCNRFRETNCGREKNHEPRTQGYIASRLYSKNLEKLMDSEKTFNSSFILSCIGAGVGWSSQILTFGTPAIASGMTNAGYNLLRKIKDVFEEPGEERSEREVPNALIEGAYHDSWGSFNYKLANIEIPENVKSLDDGEHRYSLYGIAAGFEELEREIGKEYDAEMEIKSASLCDGVTLPYRGGGFPNHIERPRSICTKDGRIFVEEDMLEDDAYLEKLSTIVKSGKKVFKEDEENYEELYASADKEPCRKTIFSNMYDQKEIS